jgi:hypothetical protein
VPASPRPGGLAQDRVRRDRGAGPHRQAGDADGVHAQQPGLHPAAHLQQGWAPAGPHNPDHLVQLLSSQWCRPYQRALLGKPGVLGGIDFRSVRPWKIAKADARRYYCNQAGDLYRDYWVADFGFEATEATGGAAVRRRAEIYYEIYVDEVQDMVGYDLWVMDRLLRSDVRVVMVGDPRQHTYATNQNRMNTKYRGARIVEWLEERRALCQIEPRTVSYRCNQAICDFADALYPGLPRPELIRREPRGRATAVMRENQLSRDGSGPPPRSPSHSPYFRTKPCGAELPMLRPSVPIDHSDVVPGIQTGGPMADLPSSVIFCALVHLPSRAWW